MTGWTRRTTLASLGAMLMSAAGVRAGANPEHDEGLGDIAALKGLRFGSAMMLEELGPASRDIFVKEVRAITPSNELKLPEVRPTPEVVDFSAADKLIGFAERHHFGIRGHTLIWNEWQPDWVKALSPPAIERLIDDHVSLLCGHYAGRIFCWDVVNEPLATENSDEDWLAHGPFFDALGEKYIGQSLRRARAADPTAKLLINETHTERDDAFGRRQGLRLLRLIDQLQDKGVPLDGIGLQGHLDPSAPFRPDSFLAFCGELERRGLEIHITELDVTDEQFPSNISERDARVASAMYAFLSSALQCKAVKAVFTWHLADNFSYPYREAVKKSPLAVRRPRPVLFDDTQQRKPAWHALARAFAEIEPRQ